MQIGNQIVHIVMHRLPITSSESNGGMGVDGLYKSMILYMFLITYLAS